MLPEILSVLVEGGGNTLVPLTPITTFRDVSACVRDPGDPLPLILEESPLGARVVAGWERPLELLRLWGTMREQVKYTASFTLSRHLRHETSYSGRGPGSKAWVGARRSRTPDSTAYDTIDPWELYELKDELKDLQDVVGANSTESSSRNYWGKGYVPPVVKKGSSAVRRDTRRRHITLEADKGKENDVNVNNTTEEESRVLWSSFNSHTKDLQRYNANHNPYPHSNHHHNKRNPKRSLATQEIQSKHLRHLLQESRMAALCGTPFKRGSIPLKSFPTYRGNHDKCYVSNEKFSPSPYKRYKTLLSQLDDSQTSKPPDNVVKHHNNVIKHHNNVMYNDFGTPNQLLLKEEDHETQGNSGLKSCLINGRVEGNDPNSGKSASQRSDEKPGTGGIHPSLDLSKRQTKLTCVSPTTHRHFCNSDLNGLISGSIPISSADCPQNARAKTKDDSNVLPQQANKIPFKPSQSFFSKVLSPRQKQWTNQGLSNGISSKTINQSGNVEDTKRVQSKFNFYQKTFHQMVSGKMGHHPSQPNKEGFERDNFSHAVAKVPSTPGKSDDSPDGECKGRSKFLRRTPPEDGSPNSSTRHKYSDETPGHNHKKSPEPSPPSKGYIFPFDKFMLRSPPSQKVHISKNSPPKSPVFGSVHTCCHDSANAPTDPPPLVLPPLAGELHSLDNNTAQTPKPPLPLTFTPSNSDTSSSATLPSPSVKVECQDKCKLTMDNSSPTSPLSLTSESEKNGAVTLRKSRSLKRMDNVDHRRSYSDPLCEYLQDLPEQADYFDLQNRRRRHSGGFPASHAGMKDSQLHLQQVPDSGEVTVGELREMAARQQQQIEAQQQLLAAREQRLKYLKQQDGRSAHVALEADRLRRLRERVEAQEAKLRRLRALRGQVDSSLLNAASLSSDLEAMRHLFSEKEKELVDAAAKVEALTRQLEEVRGDRGAGARAPASTDSPNQPHLHIHQQELDKLRRELLYRNSVNREASSRVTSQREALSSRKEEIARIDKRIAELQQRLYRKRFLNQQLASQISAATQAKQTQLKAVHQRGPREGNQDSAADDVMSEDARTLEDLVQFERGTQDPKYQTLPYNTKFSSGGRAPQEGSQVGNSSGGSAPPSSGVVTRTVHSIPTHLAAKGHASAPPGQGAPAPSSGPTGAPSSAPHPGRGPQHPASTRTTSSLQQHQSSGSQGQAPHQSHGHFPPKVPPEAPDSSTGGHKAAVVQPQQQLQHHQNSSSTQELRTNLPPTSLSVSFAQKLNQGVKAGGSRPGFVLPSLHHSQTHNKDVENVRALGIPAGSTSASLVSTKPNVPTNGVSTTEDESTDSASSTGKVKPILPPKPAPPSKPTPPPRQKGDPMAGSTESLNFTGVSRPNGQSRPQVFRYASQNVILSTYTQQQQDQKQSEQKQLDQKQQHPILQEQLQQQPHTQPNNSISTSNSNLPQHQMTKDTPKSILSGVDANNTSEIKDSNNRDGTEVAPPEKVHISINRRIEMPPDFLFPEDATPPSDLLGRQLSSAGEEAMVKSDISTTAPPTSSSSSQESVYDVLDMVNVTMSNTVNNNNVINVVNNFNANLSSVTSVNAALKEIERLKLGSAELEKESAKEGKGGTNPPFSARVEDLSDQWPKEDKPEKDEDSTEESGTTSSSNSLVVRRLKKGNLKNPNASRVPRRVSFDPLALLLDASLEGELELVKRTATEVPNPSAANDEGITALHNAICAGHLDIVTFLVTFGCDVNAQDSDGWTPLHCAASCNNVAMVRFLVEHGACVLATTLSDHETAAEKCEQDEEGYDGCSQYLYSVQEKLGIMNGGVVFGVYDYEAQNEDELTLKCGDSPTILRRGDEYEREWWWAAKGDKSGYVPRNLLGLYPRVKNIFKDS